MVKVIRFAWQFALTVSFASGAVALPTRSHVGLRFITENSAMAPPIIEVQQGTIPDVVQLLAQRAVRAERRGDMETADELYGIIREMGYVVRRPERGGNDADERDPDSHSDEDWGGSSDRDDENDHDDEDDHEDDSEDANDDRDDDDHDDDDGDDDDRDDGEGDDDDGGEDGGDNGGDD